jgi:hypothetical protein
MHEKADENTAASVVDKRYGYVVHRLWRTDGKAA